ATGCMVMVIGGTATTTSSTSTTSSTATPQPATSTTTSTTSTTTTEPSITTTTSSTTTTIPGNTCPLGQAFWKNHPSAWLVRTLGSQTYSEKELLTVLTTAPRNGSGNDASVILAHQLITAKLNIANGSDPTAIATTVSHESRLIPAFVDKLPYRVRSSSVLGQAMV